MKNESTLGLAVEPPTGSGLSRKRVRAEVLQPNTLLNVGCGRNAPPTWHNIDASPTVLLASIPVFGRLVPRPFPPNVRFGDIVRGLHLRPSSCHAVFCCHTLEHLTYQGCLKALHNMFDLLSAHGVLRVIVPDLRRLATDYLEHSADDAASRLMRWSGLGEEVSPSPLRRLFGNSRHRWMWDQKSLTEVLRKSGFHEIRSCTYGDNPIFEAVENRDRYQDSVGLEAVKP
jgi:hypothetical protein